MFRHSDVLQAHANMLYVSLAATPEPSINEMNVKEIDERIKFMYQQRINVLEDQVATLFKVLEEMSKRDLAEEKDKLIA